MSIRNIRRQATNPLAAAGTPNAAPIYVDSDDNKLKMIPAGSGTTEVEVIDASTSQTLTNKTLTSPILNGSTGTGQIITKSCLLTENGAGTSYTATIAVPAGAVVHNIRVIPQVLWNGTSASLVVGDTASSNGYFTTTNLKATDLLVGEVLESSDESLWGGVNGAYLVSATGRRGPTSSNFGKYYVAGSNIIAVVTPGAADGTAGRTLFEVEYSIPVNVAQVTV